MKLSDFVEKLSGDLKVHGDAQNIIFGLSVKGVDGKIHRLDVVISEGNFGVSRDANFTEGMACIIADYHGDLQIQNCSVAPAA